MTGGGFKGRTFGGVVKRGVGCEVYGDEDDDGARDEERKECCDEKVFGSGAERKVTVLDKEDDASESSEIEGKEDDRRNSHSGVF